VTVASNTRSGEPSGFCSSTLPNVQQEDYKSAIVKASTEAGPCGLLGAHSPSILRQIQASAGHFIFALT